MIKNQCFCSCRRCIATITKTTYPVVEGFHRIQLGTDGGLIFHEPVFHLLAPVFKDGFHLGLYVAQTCVESLNGITKFLSYSA